MIRYNDAYRSSNTNNEPIYQVISQPQDDSRFLDQPTRLGERLRAQLHIESGIRHAFKEMYHSNINKAHQNLIHAGESYHDACEGARFKFYRALADTKQMLHEFRDSLDNLRFEAQLWRYDHIDPKRLERLFTGKGNRSKEITYSVDATNDSNSEESCRNARINAIMQSVLSHTSSQKNWQFESEDQYIGLPIEHRSHQAAYNDDYNQVFSAPALYFNTSNREVETLLKCSSAPIEVINNSSSFGSILHASTSSTDIKASAVSNSSTQENAESKTDSIQKMVDMVIQMFDQYAPDDIPMQSAYVKPLSLGQPEGRKTNEETDHLEKYSSTGRTFSHRITSSLRKELIKVDNMVITPADASLEDKSIDFNEPKNLNLDHQNPVSLVDRTYNGNVENIGDASIQDLEGQGIYDSNISIRGLVSYQPTGRHKDSTRHQGVPFDMSMNTVTISERAIPSKNSPDWCTVRHDSSSHHDFEFDQEIYIGNPLISFDFSPSSMKLFYADKGPQDDTDQWQSNIYDEDYIYDEIYALERVRFDSMPKSMKIYFPEYPPYIYEKRLLKPLPPSLKVLFQDPEHDYNWTDVNPDLLHPYNPTLESDWDFDKLIKFVVPKLPHKSATPVIHYFNKCWFCGHHIVTRFHNCRRVHIRKQLETKADNIMYLVADICEDIKLEMEWLFYKLRYEIF
ncbi:HFR005Cp [Eremothecium sinecaudum]|uniref:HFR005Cp n=1 Tax=Eremothecium sinecaudum TaxID=45286 RepID=A0A0X8HUX7_9SACH|nr:HFR005Cp [Eremothecium sinecaudum]AMD21860.1 HFR005Cp [Eremothecium sinecaudum]